MEIKRDDYLRKLASRKQNGMVKIVTGVRRCGKSYLLFRLFCGELLREGVQKDHIIKVALDDLEYEALRNPHELYAYLKSRIIDDAQYYVILDEIQFVPRFHEVLNSLLHKDNVDVYVTGSNSKFLSSDVVTEFRGRGDEVRVRPLCFREFMSAYDGSEEQGWNEYFNYGGLPLILSMSEHETKADYLKSLFEKVCMADILERHKLRNREEMDILMNILASAVGSLTNPKKLADTFHSTRGLKISQATLKRYMGYLEDAFLISRADRYDIKGKRYISTPSKYYFEDVGLRNARLNFRQQEENHIMENIIYNELRVRGYSVDVGVVEINARGENGNGHRRQLEVDFVADKVSRRYYIQSAFTMWPEEKAEQERRSLNNIPDSFKKIIVVRDNILPTRNEQGILTLGVRQFLLDENSLEL